MPVCIISHVGRWPLIPLSLVFSQLESLSPSPFISPSFHLIIPWALFDFISFQTDWLLFWCLPRDQEIVFTDLSTASSVLLFKEESPVLSMLLPPDESSLWVATNQPNLHNWVCFLSLFFLFSFSFLSTRLIPSLWKRQNLDGKFAQRRLISDHHISTSPKPKSFMLSQSETLQDPHYTSGPSFAIKGLFLFFSSSLKISSSDPFHDRELGHQEVPHPQQQAATSHTRRWGLCATLERHPRQKDQGLWRSRLGRGHHKPFCHDLRSLLVLCWYQLGSLLLFLFFLSLDLEFEFDADFPISLLLKSVVIHLDPSTVFNSLIDQFDVIDSGISSESLFLPPPILFSFLSCWWWLSDQTFVFVFLLRCRVRQFGWEDALDTLSFLGRLQVPQRSRNLPQHPGQTLPRSPASSWTGTGAFCPTNQPQITVSVQAPIPNHSIFHCIPASNLLLWRTKARILAPTWSAENHRPRGGKRAWTWAWAWKTNWKRTISSKHAYHLWFGLEPSWTSSCESSINIFNIFNISNFISQTSDLQWETKTVRSEEVWHQRNGEAVAETQGVVRSEKIQAQKDLLPHRRGCHCRHRWQKHWVNILTPTHPPVSLHWQPPWVGQDLSRQRLSLFFLFVFVFRKLMKLWSKQITNNNRERCRRGNQQRWRW